MHEDLHESYSFLQERTQYFTRGDRCFGLLPVVGCLPDEDVYRSSVRVTAFFARFTKHTRTEKCNFVAGQEANYLNFSHKVPSPAKSPIRFLDRLLHM